MLNARLFTSALPIFLFVRDKPVLACQGNSFRGRGKSTSCTHVRSFVRTPLEDNLGVSGGDGVSQDGHHLGVKRGCSVSGISSWDRKRHFVPSRFSPRQEVGSAPTNDHRDQQVATKVQHEVNPSRYPHHALLSSPVTRLCIFQPRNATFMQMER